MEVFSLASGKQGLTEIHKFGSFLEHEIRGDSSHTLFTGLMFPSLLLELYFRLNVVHIFSKPGKIHIL